MGERPLRITSAAEIPATWGQPRPAWRKSLVRVRAPAGVETLATPWGTLTAVPDEDWVVLPDSGAPYPIKRVIFAATYVEVAPGRYRKIAPSRLVQVPPAAVALLVTREGEITVRHPDYVVVGAEGEVYANSPEWVAEHLTFESLAGGREAD